MENNSKDDIAIKWSPLVDEDFILVGNSINFYHLTSIDASFKNRNENNLYVSENTCAKLIGSINNYQNKKMVAWYPWYDFGRYTIALHEEGSSQIRIIRMFDQEERSNVPALGYNIGVTKKCNQIEWNPIGKTILGLGFENSENSSSLCFWDLKCQTDVPICQLDETETCYSFAWSLQNDVLFATFKNRLSVYDIRASTKPIKSIKTEFIHGYSVDPNKIYLAASYDDNNKIVLWDWRKIRDQQQQIIEETRKIKQIQFCPSKSNRLAVLTENSTQVNIYRLREENEIFFSEQFQYSRNYKNLAFVNSFSWHSKDSNKLMTAFSDTYILKDYIVAEYSPIGLSVNETLNVVFNERICTFKYEKLNNEIDIGEKIKNRALKSYGIQDFLSNIDVLSHDINEETEIKYLWEWLHTANKIYKHSKNFLKFSGVKSILTVPLDVSSQESLEIKREYILRLCGWHNWNEMVKKLIEKKEYERAACIAVFNSGMDKAIEILRNASNTNSNEYLALSLPLIFHRANLNTNESTKILNKLANPYLKALFAFKIDPDYNKNSKIFNDPNILLSDRVCMAMSMLKNDFGSYIKDLTTAVKQNGNLFGILLTGLTTDCVDLFQSYINRTSDVQTPAVAVIHSNCSITLASKLVNGWIESYRNLLDTWMLWEQRAQFDIKIGKPLEPKVFIRCVSCGQNLSTKKRIRIQPIESNANNGMACQNCQKPSLRCSVCSLYMTIHPPKSAFVGNKDKMAYWFLFCQKCSHGGHLGHLESWFKTNPECPVMNCSCLCYNKEDFFDDLN